MRLSATRNRRKERIGPAERSGSLHAAIDDAEPIPIDLLEGPISMHPAGIEPTNLPLV